MLHADRCQSIYASQLLTIVTLTCAKLAVSQLILAIRPQRVIRLALHVVEGVIGVWFITSLFALAFQCNLPHPYLLATNRCVNLVSILRRVWVWEYVCSDHV